MQFSRMKQRVPAMDWSGPKPFAESLTPQSNLTVADMVGFPSNSPAVVHGSTPSPGRRTPGVPSGMMEVPTSSEGTIRGGDRN